MNIRIFGKNWIFRRCLQSELPNGVSAQTDAPTTPNKEMMISHKLKGQDELRVIIHELLHAADWYKDEEWVHQVSVDVARILTQLGYKKDV